MMGNATFWLIGLTLLIGSVAFYALNNWSR
jgi:hypothetical protein